MKNKFEHIFNELNNRIENLEIQLEKTHKTKFLASIKPCISFNISKDKNSSIKHWDSKIGGMPDLPNSYQWPKYNDQHLIFVAQFNFTELEVFGNDFNPFGKKMLYVFMNYVETDKYNYIDSTMYDCKLLDIENSKLNPNNGISPKVILDENRIDFFPNYSLPDYGDITQEEYFEEYDDFGFNVIEPLDEVLSEIYNYELISMSQIWGNPNSVQDSVLYDLASVELINNTNKNIRHWSEDENLSKRVMENSEFYKVILQIDSDTINKACDRILFTEVYYIGIHENKFKNSSFDELILVAQNT